MALGFCANLASSPFLHKSFALLAHVLKLKLLISLDICLHSSGVLAFRIVSVQFYLQRVLPSCVESSVRSCDSPPH